ncbi:MAG: PrsW family intramembrane metalloprotease [Saprospiraceae bacterium]
MLEKILLILVAILPGLLISGYIYWMDKHERERGLPLLICFALGALITAPGLAFQTWVDKLGYSESGSLWWTFFFALIVVGFTEELLKFIAFIGYPYRADFFNEPIDGIVYCVMIGMGFATVENVIYALDYGIEIALFRGITAVPAHAVFGVVMGYYAGSAKFIPQRRNQLLAVGFLLAVLIHGLYDFFILQDTYEWLMLGATLILYVSIFFAIRMIKQHQRSSPFLKEQQEVTIAPDEPTI